MQKSAIQAFLLAAMLLMVEIDASLAQERINPDLKEVIIVYKTHFDNGYTDFSESVLRKYSTTLIDGALKGLALPPVDQVGQPFNWTLSGYPILEILRRNPGIEPVVGKAIREGLISIHALPFTFETEALSPELLVRGFRFSDEIARRYGLDLPVDAKLTDVPSHSWILPTVLAQAGVKFLHLGCNPASRSPEVPLLFWWEGPDGSRVMTMYWGGYYGTDLIPPDGWPFKSWIAIIHTNDNQGAPPAAEIRATLEQARKLAPNARIRTGRMSDFYDALIKENPDLPVIRGDMPDTWIHGYLSMPREFRDYNQTIRDLHSAESLTAVSGMLNSGFPASDSTIERAYDELLLFAEHTFGLAMSHGHSGIWRYDGDFRKHRALGDYEMIEHSWKEKGDHVFQARRLTLPTLHGELENLANSVAVSGPRIVVYNPLPYTRDGVVEIKAHSGWFGIRGLRDAVTGQPVFLENRGNIYRFKALDVPGMGYKTFIPSDQVTETKPAFNLDSVAGILENSFLRVRVDPATGRIRSILDKYSGREMVSQEAGSHPFGGYVYQRFDRRQVESYANAYIKGGWDWAPDELGRPNLDDRPGFTGSPTNPTIRWEISQTRVSATVQHQPTSQVPHHISLIYTLYPANTSLEITWAIDSKPAEPWPEAGWVAFPFNLTQPEFRVGRAGGIADPKKDFIKGSNFEYFLAANGVAIFGPDGAGFAVTSPDAPAVSLDKPGLWTWTGHFMPSRPNIFFNLFNNQWSTNFTEWIEGSWSARFYVWPFEQYDPAYSLIIPSTAVSAPLLGWIANGEAGDHPLSFSGLEVSARNVVVSAFGPDPDGGGYRLRLWESAGRTTSCTVRFPAGSSFRSARPVDLRGRPVENPIPVVNGSLQVNCPANRPLTLIIN
ncbi:MAG: glycoside hydrolase family 38 C-terminal domain-containing protein [Bacteroidales bacterium]